MTAAVVHARFRDRFRTEEKFAAALGIVQRIVALTRLQRGQWLTFSFDECRRADRLNTGNGCAGGANRVISRSISNMSKRLSPDPFARSRCTLTGAIMTLAPSRRHGPRASLNARTQAAFTSTDTALIVVK
jgi:hypothetical protein